MRKFIVVLLPLLLLVFTSQAQTVTKTFTPATPISVDGCGAFCATMPGVTFTVADYPGGGIISDVDVSITWHKTDGTCGSPATGSSFHNETSFRIDGPAGTVWLADPGTWSGGDNTPVLTTVFDQGEIAPGPGAPFAGSFSPNNGNLDDFSGLSSLGTWNLVVGDNAGADPVCIHGYSVTVTHSTTCSPDVIAPIFTSCQTDVTIPNTPGTCGAAYSYSMPLGTDNFPLGSDNCAGLTITQTSGLGSGAIYPVGTTTETYVATDAAGLTATCTFDITVEDTENPVITCPASISVNNDPGFCSAVVSFANATATDNCPGVAVFQNGGIASGSAFPVGANSVTFQADDASGNSVTCSISVTVIDNIPPAAFCQNITVQLNASGDASITSADINNGSIDECGIADIRLDDDDQIDYDCGDVGSNSVSLTVTDNNGNISTCSSTVIVEDNIAPIVSCVDFTVQLDNAGSFDLVSILGSVITASDACGFSLYGTGPRFVGCADVGTSIRVFGANDGNGNLTTCSFNLTVQDVTLPSAVCQNVTVQLDASGNGSTTAASVNNGSSDACGIASLSLNNASFDCNNIGANTVTLTVTDNNNNSSSCTATVTVQDNLPPIVTCTNITIQLDATGSATISTGDVGGGSDNCGLGVENASPASFNCLNVGGNTVTYTVIDVNGNSNSCTSTVTVQDNIAPTALCKNITVSLSGSSVSISAGDIDNGSNDNCGVDALSAGPTTFTCANIGPNTVTLTVTDVNGNASTCVSTVTVQDNTAPTAICQDLTVQLDAAGDAGITASQVDNGSSDACGIASLAVSPSSFNCGNVGSNTVTLTVTDNNSNSSTCTATVTVQDNVAPLALCQDLTLALDASGNAGITPGQVDNGSNDACSIAGLSLDDDAFDCSDAVLVLASAADLFISEYIEGGSNNKCIEIYNGTGASVDLAAGNYRIMIYFNGNTSAGQNIGLSGTIADGDVYVICHSSAAAAFQAQADQSTGSLAFNGDDAVVLYKNGTVELDVFGKIGQDPGSRWSQGGNQTQNQTLVRNASILAGNTDNALNFPSLATEWTEFLQDDASNLGSHTVISSSTPAVVTLTVTDNNGNASACTANITVEDNVAPIALCNDLTIQLDAGGSASIGTGDVDGGSSDACGIESLALSQEAFGCSDIAGGALVWINEFHYDNASGDVGEFVEVAGVAGTDLTVYSLVLYNGNNQASYNTFALPGSIPDEGGSGFGAVSVLTSGLQNGSPDGIALIGPGGVVEFLSYEGSFTASGGPADGVLSEDVGVSEPSSTPIGLSLQRTGGAGSAFTGPAAQSPGSLNSGQSIASGSGVETTLTVTDVNGNVSECTANVTVEDNIAPQALCQDLTVQLDANGIGSVTPAQVDNGSNDACGLESLTLDVTSFGCNEAATTVQIEMVALDLHSNSSSCISLISVEDNVAPVALCQNLTVQLDALGAASVTPTQVDDGSNDACGLQSISLNNTSFGCGEAGTTVPIELVALDLHGNTSSCTSLISVEDNVDPIALCQDLTVQLDANGTASVTPAQVDNGSNDACGIASISLSNTSFTCNDVAYIPTPPSSGGFAGRTVTYNSVVINGQNTQVLDVAPGSVVNLTLNWTNNYTSTFCPGCIQQYYLGFDGDGVGESCLHNGNTAYTFSKTNSIAFTAPVTPGVYTVSMSSSLQYNCISRNHAVRNQCGSDNGLVAVITVGGAAVPTVLTVTDANGNTSTCNADITVEDNVAPEALCQDITIQLDASGNASITTGDIDAGSNDACGIKSLALDDDAFTCADVGGNPVMLTVTDNHCNVSSCNATVTVQDNVAPNALCQDITIQLSSGVSDGDGAASIIAADIDGGSSDACGIVSLSASQTNFDCSHVGSNTVTLTVTDNHGNVSSCSAVVVVEDNVAPTLICQDVTVQLDATGNISFDVSLFDNGSFDNCGIASFSPQTLSGTCTDVGTSPITVTVVDVNGNVSTCTPNVTLQDVTPAEAICQDVTVTLDLTGNYALSAGEIDNGSNDACGIASLSVAPSAFTCSEIGPNTVTLTVTDVNGNVSTCTATVTVVGIVPVVTISESLLPTFCQGGTIVLTANSDVAVQFYSWSTSETTQSIQVNADGVYTVDVTSFTGCVTTVSYTITGYDAGTILSSYTILGIDEVHLHGENLVETGGVGVINAGKKAKLHDNSHVLTFIKAPVIEITGGSTSASNILAQAGVTLPPFFNNPFSSNNDVKVEDNQTLVLADCVYDKVEVKKNATAIFTCENVFIHELKTKDGATIIFDGSTNVFINKKVKLDKNNSFNPTAEHVTVYVDDKFEVKEGSDVHGHVYALKDIHAHGKDNSPISMTGTFIGKKIHGNHSVTWNWDTNCDPAPLPDFPPACDNCKGGVTQMDLTYNGLDSAFVEVTGENGTPVYFSGMVGPGETITVVGDPPGDKLDKNTEIYVDGGLHAEVHTSGSQPIGPGLVLGDFTMAYAECKDNDDPICPVDLTRIVAPDEEEVKLVSELESIAYPNPFRDKVLIEFNLPDADRTTLEIVNINGDVVHAVDLGMLDAYSKHTYEFDPDGSLSGGTYLYRIISGKHIATGKLILMK